MTTLGSVLLGCLILLGIGGIAYHLFRDDGWISQGLSALWKAQYEAPVLTIILIVAAIFIVRTLYTAHIGDKPKSRVPDLVLMVFIATGIYFLGRLLILGEI